MFDFDISKLLIFGIVALAVIPPKDLPRVMRTIGQVVGKMRRTAAEFQGQFMDAMREADLESVKTEFNTLTETATKHFNTISQNTTKEFEAMNAAAKIDASFDPALAMRDEMSATVHKADEIGASTVALDAATPTPAVETASIPSEALVAEPLAALPAEAEVVATPPPDASEAHAEIVKQSAAE